MIKYNEWGKHIRQGNWMFLYAGLQSISKDSGNELVLPENYYLWKYLENPPRLTNDNTFDEIFHFRQTNYTPEEYDYIINYFKENKDKVINVNLGSHLQSQLWFEKNKDYIDNLLKIKEEEIQKVKEKYDSFFNKPTIGVSIRRGDFVGHGTFFQIPEWWYEKMIKKYFPNWFEYNIIVFSDNIDWCKNYYSNTQLFPFMKFAEPNNTHTHADNFKHYHNDPMKQFILGTQCDNMIIGNSTFSWWLGYYVYNFRQGKVIHCGRNLSEQGEKQFYNPDYYPTEWIKDEIR